MKRHAAAAVSAAIAMAFAPLALSAQEAPAQQPPSPSAPSAGSGAPAMRGMMGGSPGQRGMMGEGMMGPGMMGSGMERMHGHVGMMGGPAFEHIEGRLAFLKAELKITPAQEAAWSRFADAARGVAQTARTRYEQRAQAAQSASAPPTATARLDRYEQSLSHRLEAVRAVKGAFAPLYAALSDDQKKLADQLLGPMAIM